MLYCTILNTRGVGLFKPDRKYNLSVNEQAAVDNLIGKGGFDIGSSSEQDFGAIEKLSPLFIYDTKKAEALVPTPRDHCISDSDEFKNFAYSADSDNGESFLYAPFSPDDFVFDEFTFSVDGSDSGIRRGFCKSFKVKNGLANSYMYVNSGAKFPPIGFFKKFSASAFQRSNTNPLSSSANVISCKTVLLFPSM